MAITPLPTAPSPGDTPTQFNTKAFAWVASLDTFVTETNALVSGVNDDASTATTQAGIATAQAVIATAQADIATTKASEASASASTASGAATNAINAFDDFDDRYLGAKASDPSTDNDGDPLVTGALYYKTGDGMRVWTGSAWEAAYLPASGYVTLTGTETLTNKTLEAASLTNGYTEEVYAVSGTTPALSPTNGSIQTWTLSGNSTPTAGTWAAGQSITLMVDDGTDYTITWSSLSVTWKTDSGAAPTLNTSGYTAIALWKVGSDIFGARVGDA